VKLRLSQRFRDDLRQEYQFIRQANPAAARVVRDRIIKAIQRLKRFPESGRAWRLAGSRELVIAGLPYIVIYMVDDDAVVVLSLFHESREVPHVH
jgi:toxin ParE1/3/4